jgi:6-hydroxycyclohex-1-ene-1-carbonyl-CoA dehydrogenase
MKSSIRGLARESGRGHLGWKIFEMSGNTAGQSAAWGLLDFGAYLAVVGYTAAKVELRLANLMAFDATARGNWGCAPANYPPALKLVLENKIALEPYIERHALSELPHLFEARHEIKRRAIVRPQ